MSPVGGAGVEIYFHRNQVIDLRKKNIYKLELHNFVDWYLIIYTMPHLVMQQCTAKELLQIKCWPLNAQSLLSAVVTEVFSFPAEVLMLRLKLLNFPALHL